MKRTVSLLLILLLFVCAVGCGDSGASSAEEAAKGFVTAVYKNDIEKAVNYLYQGTKDRLAEKENASNGEVVKVFETDNQESEDAKLKNLEVTGATTIEKREEIDSVIEEIYTVSMISFGDDNVEKIIKIEIELTEERDGEEGSYKNTITCVKIGGEWFVAYFD